MTKAKPKAVKVKVRPKAKPKAKTKAKAKAKAKPKAKVKPKTKPKAKPKAKAKPRTRRPAPRPARQGGDVADLLEALDDMQDAAPGSSLEVRNAPASQSRTPWLMAARFGLPGGTSYEDVANTLRDWRDSRRVEKRIGSQRLSRIQVRYTTDRGEDGEYTLAEIGAWGGAIERAHERVAIHDDGRGGYRDSLIARYGEGSAHPSEIKALIVWFAAATLREVAGVVAMR